ncbi:MAG: radical SAM protein [Bdellovibrionaceae bacterium]|nr:radical SAM protein [Pseudobdellovibrionaceae bacterium]
MSAKLKPLQTSTEYEALHLVDRRMEIVYGPHTSRRLGLTLGVNLLGAGQKVCSFDCAYCDLGPTEVRLNRLKNDFPFPSFDEIRMALEKGFPLAHQSVAKINAISIAGNGEPTLHPAFSEVMDLILKRRDLDLPGTPVIVLTNGAHLDSRKTVEALNKADERMLKFDAGNERMFKTINAPLVRASVSKILAGVNSLKDVTVQSFFVQGAVDNTSPSDIEDWMEVIGLIKPKAVHLHGMNRVPALSGLQRCEEDTLYTIASRLERRTQIRSLVFP